MLYQIYFSPTGGTKKAADLLGTAWEGEKREIDLSLAGTDYEAYSFQEEDICLTAVPSFGGRAPAAALSRLRRLNGRGAQAVPVVVYGNRAYEDTLLELEETLIMAGFRCPAAVAAVAEHSIMHQFGAGRPDMQDEQELKSFAGKIKGRLDESKSGKNIRVPGNTPYKEYHVLPFLPKADKRCTACGLCVKRCPVGAIPEENPSSVDEERCISCMRCVSLCPRHARDLNKMVLFAAVQKLKKACGGRKENELFI